MNKFNFFILTSLLTSFIQFAILGSEYAIYTVLFTIAVVLLCLFNIIEDRSR